MAPRPEPLERLLRLAASLEEAIITLELKSDARQHERTILRLRVMQGEILGLLHRLEGDSLPID